MNKKTITIRPIDKHDSTMVVDFYTALSDDTWSFFHPHPRDPEYLKSLVQSLPDRQDLLLFKAILEEDGKEIMAGTVFFWDWQKKIPWLGIGVLDDYQGMGIGDKLMQHAISTAWRNGKGGILLTTHKNNLRAQALYKKHGFEIIGTDTRDEHIMILR